MNLSPFSRSLKPARTVLNLHIPAAGLAVGLRIPWNRHCSPTRKEGGRGKRGRRKEEDNEEEEGRGGEVERWERGGR